MSHHVSAQETDESFAMTWLDQSYEECAADLMHEMSRQMASGASARVDHLVEGVVDDYILSMNASSVVQLCLMHPDIDLPSSRMEEGACYYEACERLATHLQSRLGSSARRLHSHVQKTRATGRRYVVARLGPHELRLSQILEPSEIHYDPMYRSDPYDSWR